MTLNEWSSIQKSRQHELVIQWHKNDQWEVYEDMADEAARLLGKELKSISGVTNVCQGGGKTLLLDGPASIRELILSVRTSLPEMSRLERLPVKFLGFRVEQTNFGDKRDAFFKTLSRILKELKGWSEAETLKWANERNPETLIDSLNGGHLSLPVYSRGPVTMAVEILINERRNELIAAGNHPSNLLSPMRSIIYDAVEKAGSKNHVHIEEIPNFDWDSVRYSVKEFFEKTCCGQSTK